MTSQLSADLLSAQIHVVSFFSMNKSQLTYLMHFLNTPQNSGSGRLKFSDFKDLMCSLKYWQTSFKNHTKEKTGILKAERLRDALLEVGMWFIIIIGCDLTMLWRRRRRKMIMGIRSMIRKTVHWFNIKFLCVHIIFY